MLQKQNSKLFCFKEFANLDMSENADYLIKSMDVMSSLESIKAIKYRALDSMCLRPGDRVLEVGCGHGEDAEALGAIVGDTGSVIAIDASKRMIDEAAQRSTQSNVEYLQTDAYDLNYSDHIFSACHADRLLVSHEDYRGLFKEILRLIKQNGVVCFTDVDALSIILTPFNFITKIILEQIHKSFVNPYMGRILPELFIENGLREIKIIPETSMIRSFETLSEIFQFSQVADSAIEEGKLTRDLSSQWFKEMYQAEKEEKFLYCVTFFTVLGKIPNSPC
ncbi:MAG: methyltransferase domain-containing protein [Alphaproteobacteria bacterium]|nr:methyltransferase domain-containing protein [Alphaproteobacteria bacterium]